jgi:phytoene desaturase
MSERAVIVGAGVGGLATAIRLRHAGLQVHVVEKTDAPGGRCGVWREGGYTFDLGPTIVLLKPVFEALFKEVGRKLEDYLDFRPCDPNYRIHFADGSSVRFAANLREMQAELERIEPGAFSGYLRYLEHGRKGMQAAVGRFVTQNFDSFGDFATPGNLREVFRSGAHKSLWSVVSRYFQDERLRIALTFQTMYMGIAPQDAPGIYALLPYTELADGIWFPMGGLHAIPRALEKLARELGVTFEYEAPVAQIETSGARATGVRLVDGRVIAADVVVANADLPYVYRALLPQAKFERREKLKFTSSGFMLYLGLDKKVPGLEHHNVFLTDDFAKNFEEIFTARVVPSNPSFYVNVANRTDPSLSPEGTDGLYVLVPVPHQTPGLDWRVEGPKLREVIFDKLEAFGFGDLRPHVKVERALDPDGWQSAFNLEKGSAFGLAHNFFQVGYFRPKNQDDTFRNVYFVGASTQPGTGLPMVLFSAQLCAERVLARPAVVDAA